jgi:hypothetical protein
MKCGHTLYDNEHTGFFAATGLAGLGLGRTITFCFLIASTSDREEPLKTILLTSSLPVQVGEISLREVA